jgi:hypothetical protein
MRPSTKGVVTQEKYRVRPRPLLQPDPVTSTEIWYGGRLPYSEIRSLYPSDLALQKGRS